ncbi:MAG: tripartite tricarboxylate transporter substrate binding protein [Alphaproteobacteria bacterium]|nr:tripartite tricarboxylate transporter substrate binding protein [Alphaproteobacteria bacterium]
MRLFTTWAFALLLGSGAALADTWPSRPVRVIIPFAAGGGSDVVARPLTDRLSRNLGQQFVIEYRGGAAGAIGIEGALKAPADGYTLIIASSSPVTVLPRLRKIPYDPERDMVLVARLGDAMIGLGAHPTLAANSVGELIDLAKRQPGKVAFGSAGLGTATQMYGELFKLRAGIDITHIPYKGSGESLQDLLAGHIQIGFESIIFPHVKAGRLKMLAVATNQRLPEFPDVPTMAEAGVKDFDMPLWQGLMAHIATPAPVVEKLNAEVRKILAMPEMRDVYRGVGYLALVETAAEAQARMRHDIALMAKIITDANITLD